MPDPPCAESWRAMAGGVGGGQGALQLAGAPRRSLLRAPRRGISPRSSYRATALRRRRIADGFPGGGRSPAPLRPRPVTPLSPSRPRARPFTGARAQAAADKERYLAEKAGETVSVAESV